MWGKGIINNEYDCEGGGWVKEYSVWLWATPRAENKDMRKDYLPSSFDVDFSQRFYLLYLGSLFELWSSIIPNCYDQSSDPC